MSDSEIGADAGEDDIEIDLLALDLLERGDDRLDRALDVALDDDLEHLVLLVGDSGEKIFQRDARGRLELAQAQLLRAVFREFAGLALLLERVVFLARRGAPSRPRTFTGIDGPASFTLWPRSLISAFTRP